ncbi:MAG: hypothetical protein AAGD01_04170 [Acidobacteriota bacterium]
MSNRRVDPREPRRESSPGSAGAFALLLALPLALGSALRWVGLGEALFLDDEVHALRWIAAQPASELWFRYGASDPCWPLAMWGEWGTWLVQRWGAMPAQEWWLRAPVAAVSALGVIALPFAARSLFSPLALARWGWLLALSPLLVLFGRVARPYGVLATTVPLVGLLLILWLRRPAPRIVALSALLTGVSAALSPLVLPALLAPLLCAGAWRQWRQPRSVDGGGWRATGMLWAAHGAALLVALGPAAESLMALAGSKAGVAAAPSGGALLRLLAGISFAASPPLAWGLSLLLLLCVALAIWGLTRRGDLPLALLLLLPAVAQGAALAWLRPLGWSNPLIAARYLLPTLPLLLLLVASGWGVLRARGIGALKRPERELGNASLGGGRFRPAVWTAPWLALILLLGSLGGLAPPGSMAFRTHNDGLRFERPVARLPAEALPPALAALPAPRKGETATALIQLPLRHEGHFSRAPYAWAAHHRRGVLSAGLEPFACAPFLLLQRTYCPRPELLLKAPARYLVLVLDPEQEESRLRGLPRPKDPRPRRWEAMRGQARRLQGELTSRWGEPMAADGRILIWDLEALRNATSAPSPPEHDKLSGP